MNPITQSLFFLLQKKRIALLFFTIIFYSFAWAESNAGINSASAHLQLTVIVPPVFQILHQEIKKEGVYYTVFTNMRNTYFQGKFIQFSTPGTHTVFVPIGLSQDTFNTISNP